MLNLTMVRVHERCPSEGVLFCWSMHIIRVQEGDRQSTQRGVLELHEIQFELFVSMLLGP
jgi:hypothetical protein